MLVVIVLVAVVELELVETVGAVVLAVVPRGPIISPFRFVNRSPFWSCIDTDLHCHSLPSSYHRNQLEPLLAREAFSQLDKASMAIPVLRLFQGHAHPKKGKKG
jgi:hypothetical protein